MHLKEGEKMTEERRKELASFKHMLILTIPIFIELLLQLVVGYSDQLMMSNWQNAVNGITNANVVINMVLNFFVIFASASIILITQYKGARDDKREKSVY
jgi:Na+-driven multidrug efflux pump